MADIRHFEFGAVGPSLAAASAIAGCVLGIILCTKAQKASGSSRARLLTYASLSLGAVAVWQSTVVSLLGLGVTGSVFRLSLAYLAAALACAVVTIGGALLVTGLGRVAGQSVPTLRLILAGLLLVIGIAGTEALILRSIRTTGAASLHRPMVIVAVSLAAATAIGLLMFITAARGLRWALAGGTAIGLALCGVHYVAAFALRIDLPPLSAGLASPAGVTPMYVAFPTIVFGGVLLTMMFYFTVGSATRRDLHMMFRPDEQPDEIEQWLIEEVTNRIAGTSLTAEPSAQGRAAVPVNAPILAGRRAPGTRPTPSIIPTWRSLPAPGAGLSGPRERNTRDIYNTSPAAAVPSTTPEPSTSDASGTPVAESADWAAWADRAGSLPRRERFTGATATEDPAIQKSTADSAPLPRRRNDRWENRPE